MPDAIERFAAQVAEYCAWVSEGADAGPAAARRALEMVSGLYCAALLLPMPAREGRGEEQAPEEAIDRSPVVPLLAARLPFRTYSAVFNPLADAPQPPVAGDLADDLADIFINLEEGLRRFNTGDGAAAAWGWGFSFVHHWGERATSAIRVLHCWLAANEPEMLADYS